MCSGPSLGMVYKYGALWLFIPQSFMLLPMKTMAVCSLFYFKLWLCVEGPWHHLAETTTQPRALGPWLLLPVSSARSAATFISTEGSTAASRIWHKRGSCGAGEV